MSTKQWIIGIDMWDTECLYEEDVIEHEILITCNSYKEAKDIFDNIVSKHQKDERT